MRHTLVDNCIFVSIHAPTKGATLQGIGGELENIVSIHAPTKGATCMGGSGRECIHVSIHAPTKGATNFRRYGRKRLLRFNPRSYERSDAIQDAADCKYNVSIHAPTKGATALIDVLIM